MNCDQNSGNINMSNKDDIADDLGDLDEEEEEQPGGKKKKDKDKGKYAAIEAQGYTLGRTIGRGSYTLVKEGFDKMKDRKVAIKILTKKQCPREFLKKFLPRELEILVTLSHPNLIAWYQIMETKSRFFIVMELCENGDLMEFIHKETFLSESLAGRYFEDLYRGMCYVHSQGIANRDLKCENLLIDSNNHIHISDFGFARHIDPSEMSNTFCGSYSYGAPEVLQGTPYNAFLADIWSMGVILYTMVIGKLPYDDSNFSEILKLVQSPPTYPDSPEISSQLKNLIESILAYDSLQRISLKGIKDTTWFTTNCPITAAMTYEEIIEPVKRD